ncbi:MAG: Stk1 family PASTA domain-containing Ser/Thr kinase [Lachnospiraceae bacterium]|nr:Stk1 family PASTA domain-containing Ser/Thr kinase [Lachnospiraceae bacterium]
MMLSIGTMLQDRYEILERIGYGVMSDVYKAKCHKLNRLVAIKVLKAEYTSDAGFVSKFKMEAQAAAGLSHPNIVNIYDVVDEDDIHCIVMELVEGITLKSYSAKKGHLVVKDSIGIAIQVAQGIEAAHEQHIIHRDIKPQNMLISKDGKVKVADFGIARAVSSQTVNSTVVGSVHYISPEQARGGYSDARTDIYSLGITMFEMATGRVPFEGDNTVTVALAHLEDPIVLPSMLNPEITPGFEQIILKCTEKKPENRYASIGDVISDLRRALLNPDDAMIGAAATAEDHSSDTVVLGKKELDLIAGRAAQEKKTEARSGKDLKEKRQAAEKRARIIEDDEYDEPEAEKATGLEKMITAFGVVAAIAVVAIVVIVISKLGGFLEDPSSILSGTTEATESISQKEVLMPNLLGDTQEEAEKKLEALDLSMKVILENSDEVAKGVIISQEDEPDSVIPRYSKVIVTVSNGSDKVELATLGLTEMTLDTAVRLIEGKGLKATVVEENHEEIPAGTIMRFEPVDGAALGETVTLYISKGPAVELVPVPKLEGQTAEWAAELLTSVGLVAGEITNENHDTIPAGCVISQVIMPGEQAEVGTIVDFVVSLGPKTPETQFLASLEASYPLQVSYGPGAVSAEIQIMIRLKQTVNGEVVYTKLTEPKAYTTDTTLDIRFSRIRGADGVLTGEVEIVDLTNNVVLTTYNVNFVKFEVEG